MRADLHLHSTHSDGELSVSELLAMAAHTGLELIAVTDHDSTASALELDGAHVAVLPGVEINCEALGREVHILGYGINPHDAALNGLLRELRSSRVERAGKMVDKLKALGLSITLDDVRVFSFGETMGRPHVARALVAAGHAADVADAFDRYLRRGRPGYVPRLAVDPRQAVDLIRGAGGLPVLAHPGFLDQGLFLDLAQMPGLGGVEAYYPAHSDEQARFFEQTARSRGLIVTTGSDYHGPSRPIDMGGEARTSPYLEECLQVLISGFSNAKK